MDEHEELITMAYLGDQAEKFWASDIGQYVIQRIEQQEVESIESLIDGLTDNRDREKIAMVRSIKGWFSELINEGQQARVQIEESE